MNKKFSNSLILEKRVSGFTRLVEAMAIKNKVLPTYT